MIHGRKLLSSRRFLMPLNASMKVSLTTSWRVMGVAQRIERNTIKVISDLLINLCETILVSEAGLTHRRNVNNHLHLPPFSCKRFTDIVKGKLQFTAHDLERIQKRMCASAKPMHTIIASIAEKCNFRHASSTSVGFSTVRMA